MKKLDLQKPSRSLLAKLGMIVSCLREVIGPGVHVNSFAEAHSLLDDFEIEQWEEKMKQENLIKK